MELIGGGSVINGAYPIEFNHKKGFHFGPHIVVCSTLYDIDGDDDDYHT